MTVEISVSSMVSGLADWEIGVEELDDDHWRISVAEWDSDFILWTVDEGFAQVHSTLFSGAEKAVWKHPNAVDSFLMRIHSRMIGCRFGNMADGDLAVYSDIYPGEQYSSFLVKTLEQIHYVVTVLYDLIEFVQQNGEMPSDADVDRAFDEAL